MLKPDELENVITSTLDNYPQIATRYAVQDPTVSAMVQAVKNLVLALAKDNAINITEPFIKSKDKTIIADALSKGILPMATATQHHLVVENLGDKAVALDANRTLQDNVGRYWRLLGAVSVQPGDVKLVRVEQSVVMVHELIIGSREPFHRLTVNLGDEGYLSYLSIENGDGLAYQYKPKLMNAAKDEAVYSLVSEDMHSLGIIFGDGERVGRTVEAGEKIIITTTKSYGYIDHASLKQASLNNINNEAETNLALYFEPQGLIRAGANPLSLAQMRLLASFPQAYDDNAVFMGNFDFLLRKHLMGRFSYMSVWNEVIHERHYGASVDNINHQNLTIVAKNPNEQAQLVKDAKALIAKADSLLLDRVRIKDVQPRPYHITIAGQVAALHDIGGVELQIKELLLSKYGKGTTSASYPNADGFNRQEIATLIRSNILALNDRISDFTVMGEDTITNPIKPHEWVYLTEDSITVSLTRTAEVTASIWTL